MHAKHIKCTDHYRIKILSVSPVTGILAAMSHPHPDGGHYLNPGAVDAIGVGRVLHSIISVTFDEQGKVISQTKELVDGPYNEVIGLQLNDGRYVPLLEFSNYIGMYHADQDPSQVFGIEGSHFDDWKQPPADA